VFAAAGIQLTISTATVSSLYFDIATEARAVAAILQCSFLKPGGLGTMTVGSRQ